VVNSLCYYKFFFIGPLFSKERLEKDFHLDSLTLIWLDKDNLFSNISNLLNLTI